MLQKTGLAAMILGIPLALHAENVDYSSSDFDNTASSEFTINSTHIVDFRQLQKRYDFTALRPNKNFVALEENTSLFNYINDTNIRAGGIDLNFQFGLNVDPSEEDSYEFTIYESYAEISPFDSAFIYFGKKQLSQSKMQGFKLVDFFDGNSSSDRSFDLDLSGRFQEGHHLVGSDYFVSDNMVIRGVVSQDIFENGASTKYQLTADYSNFDNQSEYSLFIYRDEFPTLGLSYSKNIGNAWVLRAESALHEQRSHNVPIAVADDGSFIWEDVSADMATYLALGGTYTHSSGSSLTLEYLYNTNGLSNSEWDAFTSILSKNNAETKLGNLSAFNRISDLAHIFDETYARRKYVFLRAHWNEFLSIPNTDFEVTTMHGIDDNSGVASARLSTDIGYALTLGSYYAQTYGDNNSQFGLTGLDRELALYATYKF